jgi:heme/copper-type cytochrome/quinol oxidase subunit 3
MIRQHAPAGHRAIDVSELPDQGAFGHQGLIWWGTVGYMVIEGSMLAMALITYFYLRLRVDEWPPSLANPDLFYGTLNLSVLLVSVLPNHFAKLAAERLDLRHTQRWLVLCVLVGIVLVVIRAFEFTALNCRWDDNAYGSMVWCLLVLHTMHLATDVGDTAVLTVLAFTGPVSVRRFIDISENGLYWYFIVIWWIPIYLTIYFAPRWL